MKAERNWALLPLPPPKPPAGSVLAQACMAAWKVAGSTPGGGVEKPPPRRPPSLVGGAPPAVVLVLLRGWRAGSCTPWAAMQSRNACMAAPRAMVVEVVVVAAVLVPPPPQAAPATRTRA